MSLLEDILKTGEYYQGQTGPSSLLSSILANNNYYSSSQPRPTVQPVIKPTIDLGLNTFGSTQTSTPAVGASPFANVSVEDVVKEVPGATKKIALGILDFLKSVGGETIHGFQRLDKTLAQMVGGTPVLGTRNPLLNEPRPIETYEEAASRRVMQGESPLSAIVKEGVINPLIDEPVGVAVKPLFFAGGFIFKKIFAKGGKEIAQEGVEQALKYVDEFKGMKKGMLITEPNAVVTVAKISEPISKQLGITNSDVVISRLSLKHIAEKPAQAEVDAIIRAIPKIIAEPDKIADNTLKRPGSLLFAKEIDNTKAVVVEIAKTPDDVSRVVSAFPIHRNTYDKLVDISGGAIVPSYTSALEKRGSQLNLSAVRNTTLDASTNREVVNVPSAVFSPGIKDGAKVETVKNVRGEGFEPTTSAVSEQRSATELAAYLHANITKKTVNPDINIGSIKNEVNVRLDKFNLSSEAQQNLKSIFQENEGFASQRRGVMTVEETKRLAQTLMPRLNLRPGTTLNAEEMQSLGDAVATLQAKVDRVSEALLTPQGKTLLNEAKLAQAREELSYALASFAGATAESGRVLNIQKQLKDALASGDVKFIKEAVALANGRMDAEEIAKRIVMFGDDTLGKIKFVRDLARLKTTDKIYELWINSILASPLSQAVNITGNTIKALLKVPERGLQAGFELARGSDRKVYFGEVPYTLIGFAEGVTEGVRKGVFVLKNGLTLEQVSKLDIARPPAIQGTVGEIIRTPTKLLTAADEFFKAVIGTGELRAQAYRMAHKEGTRGQAAIKRMHELLNAPTAKMLAAVDIEKLEGTYQQPLGKLGQKVMEIRRSYSSIGYIIPFIKTPTNIVIDAVKTSPAGFLTTAYKLKTGAYAGLPDTEISKDIAKATVGSMIAIPVVIYTLQGKITGSAPVNDAERDAFYRSGKQAYSVKIGDKWYSYRRVEPFATIIGTIADFTKIGKEEDAITAAKDIAFAIGNNITDKTFMSGLSGFLDALADPQRYGEGYVSQILAGFSPFSGLQRFIVGTLDPVMRNPQNILEKIEAQTPGLSRRVPPKRNVFGEEVTRTLSQRVSPFGITQEQTTRVDQELEKLGIFIGFPSKTQLKVKMTDAQYDQFLETSGKATYRVLDKIMSSPAWESLDSGDKERFINTVVDKVRVAARNKVIPSFPVLEAIRKRVNERTDITKDKKEEVIARAYQRYLETLAP